VVLTGPSVAFQPGTTNVTSAWLMINIPMSFVGSSLGGWVAAAIARRRRPVYALAVLVLLLALASAVYQLTASRPALPRPVEQLSTFEAASYAVQPDWYNFVIAVVGVVGVLAGERLKRGRTTSPITEDGQRAASPSSSFALHRSDRASRHLLS
jgi:pimeloyl-ACP methyl ester carboxylesterase